MRAGRGSGERTGFLTDLCRNAGAHSIAIVEMVNELQSAHELHYCNFSMIPAFLSALQRQHTDSEISSENSTSSKALSVEMTCLLRLTPENPVLRCSSSCV